MKGRTVYGGGGIMPDHIIQSKNDSLATSLVYLYTSDFFNNLAFDYVDRNRKNYDTFDNFNLELDEQDIILGKIKGWIVDELGDNTNQAELELEIHKNTESIVKRFSALIIRQLWGWSKMQIFLNQDDEIIASSLSLLND